MAVISSVLAVIGLIILVIGVFAAIGAGSTASALGLGGALTTVLTGLGSFIYDFRAIFGTLFAISLVAWIARSGSGNGLGFERALGTAQGLARGATDDGNDGSDRASVEPSSPEPDDTSSPSNPDDSATSPSSPSDPSSSGSGPPSSSGSGGSGGDANVDLDLSQMQQQQQQMFNQMMQFIVAGNMTQQNPGNNFVFPNNNINQNMLEGNGISPWVYRTFMMNAQNFNSQNLMQQMSNFIVQNNYGQLNDQVLVDFMEQVLDIQIGDSEGDNIIIQINNEIRPQNIEYFEQNINQAINGLNLTQSQESIVFELIEILNSVEREEFEISENKILINAEDFNLELTLGVVLRLIDLINQVSQESEVIRIFIQKLTKLQISQINEQVIEQILVLLQQSIQQAKGGDRRQGDIPYGDERTARGKSSAPNQSQVPVGDERTARGSPPDDDNNLSKGKQSKSMQDEIEELGQGLQKLSNLTKEEERREEHEIEELEDIRRNLSDAADMLLNDQNAKMLHVIAGMEKHNFNSMKEFHQWVHKMEEQYNLTLDPSYLESAMEVIQEAYTDIERAENEARNLLEEHDADEKEDQQLLKVLDNIEKELGMLQNAEQHAYSYLNE